MKTLCLLLLCCSLLAARPGWGQGRFMTRKGQVSFFAASIIEDIEAHTVTAAAVLDLSSQQLAFSVLIRDFVFKRTLMQEHFNENYMESDKYPKATFTGHFAGGSPALLERPGMHRVQVEGTLTMHGVARPVAAEGTLELKDGLLVVFATFAVAPAFYDIEVPLLVREHIAKIVSIRVALVCDPVASPATPVATRVISN